MQSWATLSSTGDRRQDTRYTAGRKSIEESHMRSGWPIVITAAMAASIWTSAELAAQPKPTLDFGFYRSKVEPIFLRKRAGHTRCVVCHADASNNFRLARLSAGAASWTEEQ